MAKKIRHNTFDISFSIRQQLDDIYSLSLLQPLIGDNYLPFTNGAIRPSGLSFILNDILINSRKSILEFGSGLSTLLMGRLIKQKRIECKIISVEHNEQWSKTMKDEVDKECLNGIVSIVNAPLTNCSIAIDSCLWYDTTILNKAIYATVFDMVIIDGPPAYMPSISKSRYPAYPYVIDKLSDNSIVVLDDAARNGEQTIIGIWQESFGVKFKLINGGIAYCQTVEGFSPEVFKY